MSETKNMFPSETDVVVAGLTSNGATAVRNLTAKGLTVVGVSHNKSERGFGSRYGFKFVMPDPIESLDAWTNAMLHAASQCKKRPVILPTADRYVLALDQEIEKLDGTYRAHGFGSGLRTALTSKRQTFDLAEKHNFPMPETLFIDNSETLRRFAESLKCPVLIKPEFPFDWRTSEAHECLGSAKVIEASTPDEIVSEYNRVVHLTKNLIAQEVIKGPDSNLLYWSGFIGDDGRACGQLIGRKLRVRPVHMGSSTFVQLVDIPELGEICENFLEALGYRGICGIELKMDEKDGLPKLIEVNPRYGLWEDIGIPVGVDLLYDAVCAAFGENPKRCKPVSFEQKWVQFSLDVASFLDYRKEGSLTLFDWLKTLKPPIIVNDFPLLSDPVYCLGTLSYIARSAMKRIKAN